LDLKWQATNYGALVVFMGKKTWILNIVSINYPGEAEDSI
jgi:hypothetical protein